MTKMGTFYRLEFEGLVSKTPEALQKFKAICIANLELSVEDTMDALASEQTSVLRVASSLGELEGYYQQLKAIGANVALVGPIDTDSPQGRTSSASSSSGFSPSQHDAHSDDSEEELTFEPEELLDLDVPLKPREPAPPKEYFLDVGEELENPHHSELEELGLVEHPVQSSPPKPSSSDPTVTMGSTMSLDLGPVPSELPLNDPGAREAQRLEDDFDLEPPTGEVAEEEPTTSPFSLETTALEDTDLNRTQDNASSLVFDTPEAVSPSPPPPQAPSKDTGGDQRQSAPNLQLKALKSHSNDESIDPADIYISRRNVEDSIQRDWKEHGTGQQEFDPNASFRPFKPSPARSGDVGLSQKQFMAVLGGGISLIITANWFFAPKPLQPSIPAVSDRTLARMDTVPDMLNSLRNGDQSTLTVAGTKATAAFTMQAVATIEDPPVLKLTVSTPQPPELTLEEIGHGVQPRPWMRRAESDAVTLKAVSSNEWSANVPTYIFIERGPDRRRVAGNALVYLTLNTDRRRGELSVELTYSPPGDDRLPPSGSLIDATQDGAYLVAISAKVPLTKR